MPAIDIYIHIYIHMKDRYVETHIYTTQDRTEDMHTGASEAEVGKTSCP